MRIASQLEPSFNRALERLLDVPVLAIAPGVPEQLPRDVYALAAAPIDPGAAPPPGWPFGLQWIQLVTSGLDKHPAWFLQTVPASTARGVAAQSIAEYVVAAIFHAAKDFAQLRVHAQVDWRPRHLGSVAGSTVGIVGLGAIGSAVARALLPLGARVVAVRKSGQPSPVEGVAIVPALRELLAQSDHVVLAAPATAGTAGLLGREAFAAAKKGLHVVNVGRGELIDDDALLQALDDGTVSRATLDVTVPEPLPADHPFYRHPRIWLTPHTSAVSQQSRLVLAEKFARNHLLWAQGQPLLDQVSRAA